MKYLLIILSIILLISFDSCITLKKHNRLMKDYQILLYMDTVWIFDKGRFVKGFVHHNDSSYNNQYDSVFIEDNL